MKKCSLLMLAMMVSLWGGPVLAGHKGREDAVRKNLPHAITDGGKKYSLVVSSERHGCKRAANPEAQKRADRAVVIYTFFIRMEKDSTMLWEIKVLTLNGLEIDEQEGKPLFNSFRLETGKLLLEINQLGFDSKQKKHKLSFDALTGALIE